MNDLKSSTKKTRSESTADRLTDEERAAIKDRAAELKAARRGSGKNNGESDLLAKIAEMAPEDRAIAERLRAIVAEAAPGLTPKTWYGMPAWARDGKVVCFFQPAGKFKTRYATFGFDEQANLDDGSMWPTTYALTTLGEAEEAALTALIKKAVS
ncbi:MAG TPA: DUF1801 domain-containing protein [Propionibacteriaceae bacterium]|nr:DUF1801 domain-containing protein [Propionibacteriaceae bacterium]